ncbi:MAG: hypothetical protein Q9219_005325 [cf. Caloplaca sp. 3 TL-2023]
MFSWNKAFAIFPLATFIKHETYLLQPVTDNNWPILVRCQTRGWKLADVPPSEEPITDSSFSQHRRVGDRFTWTIDLPIPGTSIEPKVPDFVLEHSQFALYPCREKTARLDYYDLQANSLTAESLKYQYTHGVHRSLPYDENGRSWRDFVVQRTTRLTLLELLALDPEDRPTNYEAIIANPRSLYNSLTLAGFRKPATWRYIDEQIPTWYRAWEEQLNRPPDQG